MKRKTAAVLIGIVVILGGTAAAWAAISMRTPTRPRHHVTAVHFSRAAGCPAVLRAVNDVARKAHVDLGTGSMTATVHRSKELAWSGELLGAWHAIPKPTAADVSLGQDVLMAATSLPLRGNADALKFIAALRKLQADCGG